MIIGLLSYEYPPDTGFGGIGTYTWYQARALARLGHEVHVLAGAIEPGELRTTTHDGVQVHRYQAGGRIAGAVHRGLTKLEWWWTRQRIENGWSMYRALRHLMSRHRFDVLEMPECGAEGYLVNPLAGVPTVVRFHSPSRLIMQFYDVRAGDIRACSAVEQWAIRRATALTSCSSFLAGEVRTKLHIGAPVEVIPNGIDMELFDRDGGGGGGLPADWPRDKPTILFTGRMERRKGIHLCGEIVQSVLRDHDVAFVFAGQDLFGYFRDTLLPALDRQAMRGSVHYLGKLDLAGVRACLRRADIFFLPSLWENCPYSCLEAMAARRAIVSSDQGGMPELIDDGVNGLTARCGDPASFAAQLRTLIASPDLRHRLGEAARRSVESRYGDDAIARRSLEVYSRIARVRGSGGPVARI